MLVWGRCGYPRVTLVTARGAAPAQGCSAHGESPGRAGALGSVLMASTGAWGAPNTALSPEGEPLPPHQDPGGLLLLRVRPHPAQGRPRALLRGDGPGHDRHHHVSVRRPRPRGPQAPPVPADHLCRGCRQPARTARGWGEEGPWSGSFRDVRRCTWLGLRFFVGGNPGVASRCQVLIPHSGGSPALVGQVGRGPAGRAPAQS